MLSTDTYKTITRDELWLANATGKITVSWPDGSFGTGSGFHIGNGYFLTAGHCCKKRFGGTCRTLVTARSHVEFQGSGRRYQISNLHIDGFEDDLDFGIVRLVCCREPKVQLYLNSWDDKDMLGESIIITHHPNGVTLKLSTGVVTSLDFGAAELDDAAYLDVNGEVKEAPIAPINIKESPSCFRYTNSSMPGSSGAPVALSTDGVVIGVHVKGYGAVKVTKDEPEGFRDFHSATKMDAINQYCLEKEVKLDELTSYSMANNCCCSFKRRPRDEGVPLLNTKDPNRNSCNIL